MLGIAIVLFVIAAIFGLFILTAVLRDRPTPKAIVFTHGPLAALAVILVIIYMVMGKVEPLLLVSLALFILAALGGLAMFAIDMKNRPIPKFLALLHPLVAAVALVLLIVYFVK
jgi:hypothetical protein